MNAQQQKGWLFAVLRLYITIVIPVLLTIASVRLVMSPLYLSFEYNRPDFSVDIYGFAAEDRLNYAPYAIDYLLNDDGIEYLGDLRLPDGTPMYNERELSHMVDVKKVVQAAFLIGVLGAVAASISGFVLWRWSRPRLQQALRDGSLLTLGIIASIVVLAVTSWDYFFTQFHTLFFAQGTWVFLYSDTLIRLFPEQFWFDAALVIGGFTSLSAVVLLVVAWRWRPA